MKELARFISALAFIASLTFVGCQPSYSDTHEESLHLITGSVSSHMSGSGYEEDGEYRPYNERHHSIGFTYRVAEPDASHSAVSHSVFRFENSYYKESYAYLQGRHECSDFTYLTACISGYFGGSTGYHDRYTSPVIPVVGVGGYLSVGPFGLTAMFVPIANVQTFQLETKIMEF